MYSTTTEGTRTLRYVRAVSSATVTISNLPMYAIISTHAPSFVLANVASRSPSSLHPHTLPPPCFFPSPHASPRCATQCAHAHCTCSGTYLSSLSPKSGTSARGTVEGPERAEAVCSQARVLAARIDVDVIPRIPAAPPRSKQCGVDEGEGGRSDRSREQGTTTNLSDPGNRSRTYPAALNNRTTSQERTNNQPTFHALWTKMLASCQRI